MKIGKPQFRQENNKIFYQVVVESTEGAQVLWYSLDEAFSHLISEACDAALVALLIPAMAIGEDIYVKGLISEKLLYNLSGPIQKILQIIIPTLKKVKIYAEEVTTTCGRAPGVATGFSGGIDSYCVLADHHYANDVPGSFKLSHLLFNNVGSHGKGGEPLFEERYKRLLPVTKKIGLPFVMVNSNLGTFYGGGLHFQQTHTLRNASVSLLLQGGVGRFMYASAVDYTKVFVGKTNCIAYSDTVTLPLLSTESIAAISVSSEYSRIEKTLRVTEVSDSFDSLDVCVNDYKSDDGYINCSTCWKCLRTLAALDVAGALSNYSKVFNLNDYEKIRNSYLANLPGNHDPLVREIYTYAKERNWQFPLSARFIHFLKLQPALELSKRLRKSGGFIR